MKHVELITSTKRLLELKPKFLEAKLLSYDTETTGLERFAEVVGCAFALSETEAYYIPIKIWTNGTLVSPWKDTASKTLLDFLYAVLTNSKRLITHNGAFDAKVTYNTFKIDILPYILADTQLLHHTVIDESPPHGLKALAVKYLDPNADSPQEDLKASVLANGGNWTKDDKTMYKADWKILGNYAAHDVIYTIGLYNKFIPHLNNDKLLALWNDEVMPLLSVTYELNTTGIRVDIPYFEKLKADMEQKIDALEDEMYALIEPKVRDYEINKLVEATKMTKVSQFGKYLLSLGITEFTNTKEQRELLYSWYTSKKNIKRVFNLNSGDDKSFLIYDVLELPVRQITASGKRSTAKSVLDELAEEFADSSIIVSLIRDRSKEIKLLNTYVIPILESHIESRIYPSFNQTGTTSGRYSCGGSSLNLQTLPREDHRIKAGFIPDEGNVFVAADYASLEPHAFAFVSGEPKLKKIFREGLDFYSSIAIDVMGLKGLSANPKDSNYLGTIDKEKRQWIKAIALAIPYGAEAGRISQLMKCDYSEAKDVYDSYMKAYPELAKWMHKSNMQMKLNGYTESLMGRRKRNNIVPLLYKKYGVKDFSKKALQGFIKRFGTPKDTILDDTQLYLECRNALNVAKNHQIQSLASSICNAAMIEFKNVAKAKGLKVKTALTIHDEIVVSCSKAESETVAALLKDRMINNKVTRLIDVPMNAVPVITEVSLAEAK